MPTTTKSAEGYHRRAFTVDEIVAMQDAGIISEDENFELIEGEIVPMGPKYSAHERIKSKLLMAMSRACPPSLIVGVETSIFLSANTFVEPDISLYAERLRSQELRGPDVQLAIEVAASSLAYDLDLKAKLYARYGVREYWVVDANQRVAFIHKGPKAEGWAGVTKKSAEDVLACAAVPEFRFRLVDA
ncbi:Uma2 family endonuclease [Methylocystis parvus]|uniref:Uma2 family endonuclease n=1 Tax=Methylocystis parvus TaxID=134 RepID=A0A6B8M8I0_9HYPH|nr:Uma2 family endonuclease [Methylocystis parvus]QGM98868.1 Uma2 family endonuclease [Methylocystis parvus]WBK00779.1 Uma2 family endonuclease [Methylocystis parvus OBBP]